MFSRVFKRLTSTMTTDKSTLLIPGPIHLSEAVVRSLGTQSISHTSPQFTALFQQSLSNLRKVYGAHDSSGLPIVISGSGTLGFDLIGSNINTKKVLLLSTGYFSDELYECLTQWYTNEENVTRLTAEHAGASILLSKIQQALQQENYSMVVMTHVDTSTGVLLDIKKVSELIHEVSPDTMIVVDTVCSLGCEEIKFHKWGLDLCVSASQKAIGAPPGLCLGMISERALQAALNNTERVGGFYSSLKKWTPILRAFESGTPAYFATPPVQLIAALDTALTEILEFEYSGEKGIDARVLKHKDVSVSFKIALMEQLHLKLVPDSSEIAAHGLTAVYVDEPAAVIAFMQQNGYTITGGIHKDIRTKYIRIGHMGDSACSDSLGHISGCLMTLENFAWN